MAEIDLLPELTEAEVKKGVYKRKVNVAAVVALLIVAGILFALYSYHLFLVSSADRIERQTQIAEERILDLSSREITRRSLVEKLNAAKNFLFDQLPYSVAFGRLVELIGSSGIFVQENKFTSAGSFTLTGDISNSDQFASLVEGFTNEDSKELFGNVQLVSLTKDEEKPGYKATIDFKFLKKGLLSSTTSAKLREP